MGERKGGYNIIAISLLLFSVSFTELEAKIMADGDTGYNTYSITHNSDTALSISVPS